MTDERVNYRQHIDPEYRRWGRKYPRFPWVSECAKLIQDGKAIGSWADIIVFELERHARKRLVDLTDTFKKNPSERVRMFVMMALECAQLPESVPFLIGVLEGGNPTLAAYAECALREIDTRESRTALWTITNRRSGA